eukprot:TRINITY_DN7428_c0_g1_i4.p1 TRINITY_DN7428_c0_g1~~TRINITY_DN7428_c0_g1_i4.p1  ORF type:complete len:508 (+),score=105.95 TRINITY_DN7428_c0_g1_i4:400-1923(+)
MDAATFELLFKEVDTDGSGDLEYDEFVRFLYQEQKSEAVSTAARQLRSRHGRMTFRIDPDLTFEDVMEENESQHQAAQASSLKDRDSIPDRSLKTIQVSVLAADGSNIGLGFSVAEGDRIGKLQDAVAQAMGLGAESRCWLMLGETLLSHRDTCRDAGLFNGCTLDTVLESRAALPSRRERQAPRLVNMRLGQEVLATGGFAQVRIARSTAMGQIWACKVLPKVKLLESVEGDVKMLHNRLLDMEDLSCRLRHSHLLACESGGGQSAEALFLLMEFCGGGDLLTWQQRKGGFLHEADAALCTAQLCAALAYLHGIGLVHRNIKPEAVLFDSKGVLKLGSYMFLRLIGPDEALHTQLGTPDYLPPEMISRRGGYTNRVDIWSLGILTFEMLTGTTPFAHEDVQAVYLRIHQGKFKMPKGLTNACRRFVKQALTQDQYKRPGAGLLSKEPWLPQRASGKRSPFPIEEASANGLKYFDDVNENAYRIGRLDADLVHIFESPPVVNAYPVL